MNLPRLLEEVAAAERAARDSLTDATQRRLIALHAARDSVMGAEADEPAA